jgi:hypothetical protein
MGQLVKRLLNMAAVSSATATTVFLNYTGAPCPLFSGSKECSERNGCPDKWQPAVCKKEVPGIYPLRQDPTGKALVAYRILPRCSVVCSRLPSGAWCAPTPTGHPWPASPGWRRGPPTERRPTRRAASCSRPPGSPAGSVVRGLRRPKGGHRHKQRNSGFPSIAFSIPILVNSSPC